MEISVTGVFTVVDILVLNFSELNSPGRFSHAKRLYEQSEILEVRFDVNCFVAWEMLAMERSQKHPCR